MTLPEAWRSELLLLLLGAAVLFAAGWWVGYPALALLIGACGYILWYQRNLLLLYRVLSENYRGRTDTRGIWRHIFAEIRLLERKNRRRKRKLTRTLKGFQESMSALPDATVVLDKQWKAEWWNGAAAKLLGLRYEEQRFRPIRRTVHNPRFSRYLEAGDFRSSVEIDSPVDKLVRLSVRVVPYRKGKYLLQARDITRVRHLEDVRKDFVANASHELRTPLTVLLGYLEAMSESEDLQAGIWGNVVDQMQQQTKRMHNIVEDMLTLSLMETGNRDHVTQWVEIAPLLAAVYQEAQALGAEKGHQIMLQVEPRSYLKGNPVEIRSLFSNLVSNAVRYTPAGGEIRIHWWIDKQAAHFSVEDTGVGIEPEHIPRLTERFYRIDKGRSREYGGTGLGLAIVKHALSNMGGQLDVKSEPGVGSVFTCHFFSGYMVDTAA